MNLNLGSHIFPIVSSFIHGYWRLFLLSIPLTHLTFVNSDLEDHRRRWRNVAGAIKTSPTLEKCRRRYKDIADAGEMSPAL